MTPPVFVFHAFDPSGINPSGFRHLTTHPSFIKVLSTAQGQFLDFGTKNIKDGKQTSDTKTVVGFFTQFNSATEALFNLRFWISNFDDWQAGTFFFNGFPSGRWIQGIKLNDASGYYVPTVLPSGQNWWRDAGGPFNRNDIAFQELTASGIEGSGIPSQVTFPFYLSVTVDTDVPVGVYGGNNGIWIYRCTFDFR